MFVCLFVVCVFFWGGGVCLFVFFGGGIFFSHSGFSLKVARQLPLNTQKNLNNQISSFGHKARFIQ